MLVAGRRSKDLRNALTHCTTKQLWESVSECFAGSRMIMIPDPEKQCHSEGRRRDGPRGLYRGQCADRRIWWMGAPPCRSRPFCARNARSTGCTVAQPDSSVGAPALARGKDHASASLRMTAIPMCSVFRIRYDVRPWWEKAEAPRSRVSSGALRITRPLRFARGPGCRYGKGSVRRASETPGVCALGTSVTGTIVLSIATLPLGPRG
jgi:hypothetical protein